MEGGKYVFRSGTVDNAVLLTRQLMQKYGIPADRVVRHYDVTHKNCPAPFVENAAAWQDFKRRLTEQEVDDMTADEVKRLIEQSKTTYATVDAVPDWGRATVEKLVKKGWLQGEENGALNLPDEMLRVLVINDRSGIYGD